MSEVQTQVIDASFVDAYANKLFAFQRQLVTAMRIQLAAVNDAIAAGDDLIRIADRKARYDSFVGSEMFIRQQYKEAAQAYANEKSMLSGEFPNLEARFPLAPMISEDEYNRRMKIFLIMEQIVPVQTQIVDEPIPVNTAEEIKNQAALAEYKDALSQVRVARVTVIQQISGLQQEIKELVNSRENLIEMFISEARAMYPELQNQDVFQTLSKVSTFHPLYQLWDQYRPKINEVGQIAKAKFANLESYHAAAEELYNKEQVIFSSYGTFQSSATTSLPTPEQLLSQLQAIESIPYAEESTLRAELNAIELLNPAAAAMVTLQTLENASEGDYSESPEQLDTQENVQVRPMAFSFDEESGTPTLPQVAAVAPAIVAQMIDPAVANTKLKNMGLCIGIAAVAYMLFGGKNREA